MSNLSKKLWQFYLQLLINYWQFHPRRPFYVNLPCQIASRIIQNLQYFFSATFEYPSNIKPGKVFDHVKNLAYQREQVLPKQNENFKSEIKHFEFFVGKSTTAAQRSKTLLSECKKNGQQNNFQISNWKIL